MIKQVSWAIIILLFVGCSESRKIAKAEKTFDRNPDKAAAYLSAKFPVVPTIIYTPGKSQVDTIWTPYTDYVPFDCPPSDTIVRYKVEVRFKEKIITKRQVDTMRITVPDSAKNRAWEAAFKVEVAKRMTAEANSKKWQEKAKSRGKTNTIFWLILVAVAIYITRKLWMPLLGGIGSWIGLISSKILKLFK